MRFPFVSKCYPRPMPGNIGWQGALLIILVLLLVFGPKRLPEMGRSLGRGLREFKESVTGKDDEEPERVELQPPAETTAPADTTAQAKSGRVSP
jgi:sec-independent protein translocase protein TatA